MKRFLSIMLALSLLTSISQSHCISTTSLKKGGRYAWLLTKLLSSGFLCLAGANGVCLQYRAAQQFADCNYSVYAMAGLCSIFGAGVFCETLHELHKDIKEYRNKAA